MKLSKKDAAAVKNIFPDGYEGLNYEAQQVVIKKMLKSKKFLLRGIRAILGSKDLIKKALFTYGFKLGRFNRLHKKICGSGYPGYKDNLKIPLE